MRAERRIRGPRATAERLLAWLVTGPIGRGGAFAVDFVAALRLAAASRLSRRPRRPGG